VVNEDSVLEDDKVLQNTFGSSIVDKDRPQNESDEDIEVDIDGSDSDEVNPCLIPGIYNKNVFVTHQRAGILIIDQVITSSQTQETTQTLTRQRII